MRVRDKAPSPPLDGEGGAAGAGRGAPATHKIESRPPPPQSPQRAKVLRAALTPAEKAIWRILKSGELSALNFRRQAPFGRYVLDFVSHPARLVVEADGSHHAEPRQAAHDSERTAFLAQEGYCVHRIWNNEALNNPNGVWLAVQAAAMRTPARERLERWRKMHAPSAPVFETLAGSPPQSSLRADSSPIEGERGASAGED